MERERMIRLWAGAESRERTAYWRPEVPRFEPLGDGLLEKYLERKNRGPPRCGPRSRKNRSRDR